MKLSGKDADDFFESLKQRNEDEKARLLAKQKAEAAQRGKEPFDLGRLEQLCDTTHAGRLAPLEERQAELEWLYYVTNPSIMTIAEFAAHVEKTNRY